MKFNVKFLAAAAALALTSVGASAQTIDLSTNPNLLLVVSDGTGNTTTNYTRIIGSLSDLTSNQTFSSATTLFSTTFSAIAPGKIYWDVFALDNVNPNVYLTGTGADQLNNTGFDVSTIAGTLTSLFGGLTQLQNTANGYYKGNNEFIGKADALDPSNAIAIANQFSFGNTTFGKGVGSSMNFLGLDSNGALSQIGLNSSLSAFNGNAKGGYFTLLDAAGTVSWTAAAAVAAVPIPAAGFLLAPGLMAFLGIRRRKPKA